MFKKTIKFAVAALALTALLSSCGGRLPDYDYQIDMEKYKDAVTADGKAYLILVNKENPCGADYVPAKLATVSPDYTLYGKEVQMERTAAIAAVALVKELHIRCYSDVVITSGYRSYEYQQILFNTYLGQEMNKHPDWSVERCEAEVLTYSARPGESEHQTGLCLDLISTQHVSLDETFAENPAYDWLVDNAHYFGFILRYPEGKEETTGYSYEPWHFRFVGVEAATRIYEKGLTLEEYPD